MQSYIKEWLDAKAVLSLKAISTKQPLGGWNTVEW